MKLPAKKLKDAFVAATYFLGITLSAGGFLILTDKPKPDKNLSALEVKKAETTKKIVGWSHLAGAAGSFAAFGLLTRRRKPGNSRAAGTPAA